MNFIYLDNAATTKPLDEFFNKEMYANPSSIHDFGITVSERINSVKKYIAGKIGCSHEEIYFTSGATESNNLAILGSNNKNIVTTKNQHPSVTESIKKLHQSNNSQVKYLDVKEGFLDIRELEYSIDQDTTLVSLTHVNNETGIIEDIKKIGFLIKKNNPKTLFHVDGVQSFGKFEINLKACNIDLFSFSSHKIHGQKGLGFLVIGKGVNIKPLFFGGDQQNGIRPGTENTSAILGFKNICEIAFDDLEKNYKHAENLKTSLIEMLNTIPDCVINSSPENSSPYILNVSFLGVKAEVLLNALSQNGVFVSTGSACTQKRLSPNLSAHNFSQERLESAIRFSFSRFNTMNEIENAFSILKKELYKLK